MGSSGHRANILGKDWDRIGIGAYKGKDGKKMWTVLFADWCGSVARARPSPSRIGPEARPRPKPQATPGQSRSRPPRRTRAPTADPSTARPIAPRAWRDRRRPRDRAARGIHAPGGQSLRVVDRPTGGLLETIFGGISGLFFGD